VVLTAAALSLAPSEHAQLVQHSVLERLTRSAATVAAGQEVLDQVSRGGAWVAIED
jgi:hypothetical protein